MIWHKAFKITGVLNSTVFDVGIESTEKEPKTLISILVQVSDYQANLLEGWIEKTKIFDLYDYLLDTTDREGDAFTNKAATRINEIPVEVVLGVGEKFQVAINCGGTAAIVYGAYVYELTGK